MKTALTFLATCLLLSLKSPASGKHYLIQTQEKVPNTSDPILASPGSQNINTNDVQLDFGTQSIKQSSETEEVNTGNEYEYVSLFADIHCRLKKCKDVRGCTYKRKKGKTKCKPRKKYSKADQTKRCLKKNRCSKGCVRKSKKCQPSGLVNGLKAARWWT